MYCRICGTEKSLKYYPRKLQTLCPPCAADTPAKVSKETFDREYWGVELPNVPESTRAEFYDDYLCSTHMLPEYILATTSTT